MAVKGSTYLKSITGYQFWRIVKRLNPQKKYSFFRTLFERTDMNTSMNIHRALTLADICLGKNGGVIREFEVTIPLPLRRELERICPYIGKKTTVGMQNDAGAILGKEIDILMGAYHSRLKSRPKYNGVRKRIKLNMTANQIAAMKIFAICFMVKEWELVTTLFMGKTIYKPKEIKQISKGLPSI